MLFHAELSAEWAPLSRRYLGLGLQIWQTWHFNNFKLFCLHSSERTPTTCALRCWLPSFLSAGAGVRMPVRLVMHEMCGGAAVDEVGGRSDRPPEPEANAYGGMA